MLVMCMPVGGRGERADRVSSSFREPTPSGSHSQEEEEDKHARPHARDPGRQQLAGDVEGLVQRQPLPVAAAAAAGRC